MMQSQELETRLGDFKTFYDPTTKIWSGRREAVNIDSDISLGQLLIKSLLRKPNAIGQILCSNGKVSTNREIVNDALSIAGHLKKLGLQQGSVVGLLSSHAEHAGTLVIAALLNGMPVSYTHSNLETDGIKHSISMATPSIMFCDGSFYKQMKDIFKEIGIESEIYTLADHIAGIPNITEFLNVNQNIENYHFEPLKEGGTQTAFIMATSGSTGLPKCVHQSHASWTLVLKKKFFYLPEDRVFCYSSLYWLIDFVVGTNVGSTRLIARSSATMDQHLEDIGKYRPTITYTSPMFYANLLALPKIKASHLSSMRCFMAGGYMVQPALVTKFKSLIPQAEFLIVYGMTEFPSLVITRGLVSENRSVGQLLNNVEIKIIAENGESLGPNEVGELLARTILPFTGYHGNVEATAAACDRDNWFYSGDLAYVDDEGNVIIVDRKTDVFFYRGFNFFPTEIEGVIMELPHVAEVCVCAIPDPSSMYLPAALVNLKTENSLTENDIYQYVADKMPDYMKLRGGIYFVNEIPKTMSGKSLRRKAADICISLRASREN